MELISSIVSNNTYPLILLDTSVYCKTDIYCSHLSCTIPQPRTTNGCWGKTACEDTCGECVPCSTTSPTIIPSSAPITVFSSSIPTTVQIDNPSNSSTILGSQSITNITTDNSDNIGINTTQEGLVAGETGTNAHTNDGLSESVIRLLIICGLVVVLSVICTVGCGFCLTTYLKHKERMKAQEMTQITRQTRVSLQPSVGMKTLQQHNYNQIGIGSQSNLNISSDMILPPNMNSQFKIPAQPQVMRQAITVNGNNGGVDTSDIGNVNVHHAQTGEMDSNVNNNYNVIDGTADKSSTKWRKEKDDNDNDDDGNVEIRYKQVSSTDIKKNVVDALVSDHEQRQSNTSSDQELYHD